MLSCEVGMRHVKYVNENAFPVINANGVTWVEYIIYNLLNVTHIRALFNTRIYIYI